MTERKWTPGPWEVSGGYVKSSNGNTVCDVRYKNGNNDRPIIAAAPDLYDALEGIISAMEGIGHGPFDAERAALAKARGEQT